MRNWKTAGIGFVMVLFMAVAVLMPTTAWADEAVEWENDETGHISELYVNPLYDEIIDPDALNQVSGVRANALSETAYCESIEEAGQQVRESLKNRTEDIKLSVKADVSPQTAAKLIFNKALKHTGDPKEGDYLRWHYRGWKSECDYRESDGGFELTLTYAVTYYTTFEQEQEVDQAVENVRKSLNLAGKSDYEKVSAIYDYICKNVTYDYANLNDHSYFLKHTAYAALMNKTAVCQGYAVLFYRLALEEGIDARVVSGVANGISHGWNIVDIDNHYYFVDATLGC